jgi:hypothetical protein
MSLISFGLLCTAFAQSFLHFAVFKANHLTFIILVTILYSFTETLIIFFFVGTGVSIKEYTAEHKLSTEYHKKSIDIKRQVYPPQMLNILSMTIVFILTGAVDTGRIPVWIYQFLFFVAIIQYLDAKRIQHACFRENTKNILAMSGLRLGQ